MLQPSIEFSHSSVHRVATQGFTVIPTITVRRVDRNTLIAALALSGQ